MRATGRLVERGDGTRQYVFGGAGIEALNRTQEFLHPGGQVCDSMRQVLRDGLAYRRIFASAATTVAMPTPIASPMPSAITSANSALRSGVKD